MLALLLPLGKQIGSLNLGFFFCHFARIWNCRVVPEPVPNFEGPFLLGVRILPSLLATDVATAGVKLALVRACRVFSVTLLGRSSLRWLVPVAKQSDEVVSSR